MSVTRAKCINWPPYVLLTLPVWYAEQDLCNGRASVRLTVCLSHRSTAAAASLLLSDNCGGAASAVQQEPALSIKCGQRHGDNLCTRHVTGSLGHRVNGSLGSSFTFGSPDHHFDPVWDPIFFRFSKKCPKWKRTFEMLKSQKSLSGVCCWTEITGCQSMQLTFTFTYNY